ncbi:MAG: TlpA disulfide reductase family protein [Pseudomonadota bacterium]
MTVVLNFLKLGVIVVISAIYASPAFADLQLPSELSRLDTQADGGKMPEPALFIETDGRERDLRDLEGTVLLVNLWATWCAPCIKEMPELDRLAAALDGQPFRVLALSQDRGGADVVAKFYADNAINHLDIVLDPRGATARAFGARGLPTSFIIDADGQVVGRLEGIAKWDDPDVIAWLRALAAGS